jgi:serine/threonine protein kinase
LFSSAFIRFVERCLVKDPNLRPSAEELLQDPFIANIDSTRPGLVDLARQVIHLQSLGGSEVTESVLEGSHEDTAIMQRPLRMNIDDQAENDDTIVSRKSRFQRRNLALDIPIERESTDVHGNFVASIDSLAQPSASQLSAPWSALHPPSGKSPFFTEDPTNLDGGILQLDASMGQSILETCSHLEDFLKCWKALNLSFDQDLTRLKRNYDERRAPVLEVIVQRRK